MQQRIETNGGIEAAAGISIERLDADRRVEVAFGVSKKRISTIGGVRAATRVLMECV